MTDTPRDKLVEALRDMGVRAQQTIDTGGRDEFDPREVPYIAPEAASLIDSQAKEIAGLREALSFYADPDTYAAITFIGDPPCGEFEDDFSYIEVSSSGTPYQREMPGKRARAAIAPKPTVKP